MSQYLQYRQEINREDRTKRSSLNITKSPCESEAELDEFNLPPYKEKNQSSNNGYTHIKLGTNEERAKMKGPKMYDINQQLSYDHCTNHVIWNYA